MKKYRDYFSLAILIAAIIVMAIFETVECSFTSDSLTNIIVKDIILRFVIGCVFIIVIIFSGDKGILIPKYKQLGRKLLWFIPCLLVVIANFPFSALISGCAEITRKDLIAPFIVQCLCVALMEETMFRGLFQSTIFTLLESKPYRYLITVAVTSAVFGLFHLLNLFSGAEIGSTLLQVGYSFLIGAMLSAVIIKTNNIWLCVIMHTIFNIGGNLIPMLGKGDFQDVCFWILTAVAGIACLVYVLLFLIKKDKATVSAEKMSSSPNNNA